MIPNTLKDLLSNNFHKKITNVVEEDFFDYLQELREEDEFSSEIISKNFTDFTTNVLRRFDFHFSPLSFYWLSLVEQVLMISEIHNDQDDESMFDFWNDTEFAEYLKDGLQNNY